MTRLLPVAVWPPAWVGKWAPGARPVAELELSWRELCRELATWREAAEKGLVGCWSPIRLARPRRSAADVADVHALVLDLDSGASLGPQVAAWAGYARAWHTTWSHDPEEPCARLVLPLAEPIPAVAWRRAWGWGAALHAASGAPVDRACSDPARPYYLPSSPARLAEYRRCGVEDARGPWLRVPEWVLAEPPPRPAYVPQPCYCESDRRRELAHDPAARERAADALGTRIVGDGDARRAKGARCPSCGAASVWWPIEPRKTGLAYCDHRRTCGWRGGLEDLLPG